MADLTRTSVNWSRALEGARLPAALLLRSAFDRNIERVERIAGDSEKRVRVATKSLRCVWAITRVRERLGNRFGGLMCLTLEEAAFVADHGFNDLLVAYPTLAADDARIAVGLVARGVTIRTVVDEEEHLRVLGEAGRAAGVIVPVVIDVDMSYRPAGPALHLGVRRSPVRDARRIIELVRFAAREGGVRVDGLMGYEAQVAGMGEANPFSPMLNPVRRLIKHRSIADVARRRAHIISELRAAGIELALFNGGGTGSLRTTGAEDVVTEVSAGSAFYCPHLFDYYPGSVFEPAAFFALQVVRRPAPGFVTCQGGGYVASGEAGPDRLPVPWSPPGLSLIGMEGAGETQTPLAVARGTAPPTPGDVVIFRHAKAGELCERFNELLIVDDDRVIAREPTYRGMGRAFL